MKIKNAFMLFYDKVPLLQLPSPQSPLRNELRLNIYHRNVKFWKDKWLFNTEFYDFVTALMSSDTASSLPAVQAEVFKCGFHFFLLVLVQSGERDRLEGWSHKLASLLVVHGKLSEWVLQFLLDLNKDVLESVVLREVSHVSVFRVIVTAIENSLQSDPAGMKDLCLRLTYVLLSTADAITQSGKADIVTRLCPLPYFFSPLYSISKAYPDVFLSIIGKGVPINLLSLLLFDRRYNPNEPPPTETCFIASSIQIGLVSSLSAILNEIHLRCRSLVNSTTLDPMRDDLVMMMASPQFCHRYCTIVFYV
jgi:hypothetical protein